MSEALVSRAREWRTSGAVLKTRLSNIRSRIQTGRIFVFEGDSDVAPYEVWLAKSRLAIKYEPLPGSGKGQVLDLRARLSRDESGLRKDVYFFVDADYDGLRGQPHGSDIFVTDGYSVENYLVCEEALTSLLRDEFRCTAESDEADRVLVAFRKITEEFIAAIRPASRRIFDARRLGIKVLSIDETLNRYLRVELWKISSVATGLDLEMLVRLERNPSPEESALLDGAFADSANLKFHRGHFVIDYFKTWLRELAVARTQGKNEIFGDARTIGFSTAMVSLRGLASRCAIPPDLEAFAVRSFA